MKRRLKGFAALSAAVFIAVGALTAAEQKPQAPPSNAAPEAANGAEQTPEQLQARIAGLIKQLGAERYEQSDAAEDALFDIGEPARKQLEEAQKDKDPEIAMRAGEVLKKLALADVTLLITDKNGKPLAGKNATITVTYLIPGQSMYGDCCGDEEDSPNRRKITEVLPQSGTAALGMLEPGDYDLTVEVPDMCVISTEIHFQPGRYTRRIVAYNGGNVKGKILGPDGKPAKGITVSVYLGNNGEQAVTTGEDGAFLLQHIPEGYIWLCLTKDAADEERNEMRADDQYVTVVDDVTTEVTLKVRPSNEEHGKLQCRIAWPQNVKKPKIIALRIPPDEGADDWRHGGDFWYDEYQSTEEDGFTTFSNLPPGKYEEVVIVADGCAPYKLRNVEIRENEAAVIPSAIKLVEGCRLTVKVRGLDGGPAYAAVLINELHGPQRVTYGNAYFRGNGSPETSWALYTRSGGEAEFDCLGDDTYAVRAFSQQEGLSDEVIVQTKRNAPASVEIKFSERTTLLISTVDKETGRTVTSGMLLGDRNSTLKSHDRIVPVNYSRMFGENKDGGGNSAYLVPPDLKGRDLMFSASGYKPVSFRVGDMPAGKSTEVKIPMERLGEGDLKVTISPGKGISLDDVAAVYIDCAPGPVPEPDPAAESDEESECDDEEPLPEPPPEDEGIYGLLRGEKAKAAGKGVFEKSGLTAGPCYVTVLDKDRKLLAMFKTVIEAGKHTEAAFTLPDAGAVAGTLRDGDGRAIPCAEVILLPDTMLAFFSAWTYVERTLDPFWRYFATDNEGRFRFDKIPAGKWILRVRGGALPLEVKAGETAHVDFNIGKPFDVTVTLKMPAGEKIPSRASISLKPVARNAGGMTDECDVGCSGLLADNTARLHGVRPGRYCIGISTNGENGIVALREVEITAENRNIEVEASLKPGARAISGKAMNLNGISPVSYRTACVVARGENSFTMLPLAPDGSFRLENLKPGKYRIFVMGLDEICVNRDKCDPVKEVTVADDKDVEGLTLP